MDSMISILGFVPESDRDAIIASHYYRVLLPLREVNKNCFDIRANITGEDTLRSMMQALTQAEKDGDHEKAGDLQSVLERETNGRDIYIRSRLHLEPEIVEATVQRIHDDGGLFVIDADDDLTEEFKLTTARGDFFKAGLGLADHVTVTTQALADHFGQYTQRAPVVLRNHIDAEWMSQVAASAKRVAPGLTIGFSGSPTHWGDWYIPAVPLARIVQDFKGVTPVLHGEVPRYLSYVARGDRLVRFGGVPYLYYPTVLSQFDIMLCAVDPNDDFNSGKSAIKALEAMAVGAVPICSRFDPYLDLVKGGAPVTVVEEDTRDGWYEAMRKIVTDTNYRKMLSRQGPGWVKANRDMGNGGYKHWERFYREITY